MKIGLIFAIILGLIGLGFLALNPFIGVIILFVAAIIGYIRLK